MREELAKELKKILPDFEKAMDKTQDGNGDTMRLVLDIPVEIASMAAWLDYQYQAKAENLQPSINVDFPPQHAHKLRAKRELYRLLWNWYQEEYHFLFHEMHSVLYEEVKADALPDPLPENVTPIKRKKLDFDNFDDDIPF